MNSIAKLFVFLLAISLSACVVKPPEEEEPTPPDRVNIKVVVNKISASKSCENDGTYGEADIYSSITISKKVNAFADLEVIGKSDVILVQLDRFESKSNPGIEQAVGLELKDGLIIRIELNTYELDRDSKRQIERTFYHTFIFNEDEGCWFDNTGDCVFGTDPATGNLFIAEESRMSDATCDVKYEWTSSFTAL